MSLEKWFRGIPLGIGARVMTQKGTVKGQNWAGVGGQVMIPIVTLWKAQLAGVVGAQKAFNDKAPAGTAKQTLRIGMGAILDVVFARWAMVGFAVEDWRSQDTDQAPDGLVGVLRYGLAF